MGLYNPRETRPVLLVKPLWECYGFTGLSFLTQQLLISLGLYEGKTLYNSAVILANHPIPCTSFYITLQHYHYLEPQENRSVLY